jgi:hypothetical protein
MEFQLRPPFRQPIVSPNHLHKTMTETSAILHELIEKDRAEKNGNTKICHTPKTTEQAKEQEHVRRKSSSDGIY